MDIYSIGLKVDSRQVKTAQKDLGGMGRQAKNTGNSVRDFGRNVDQSQKNLGKMRKGTQLVTRALGAFGVALSVRQLQQFTQQTIVAADNINKMAQTAGVSAETLQELRFAFGQLAGTTDLEVDQSLRRFNRRLGLAADGGGAAVKAFEQLNIALRDSSGGARSSEAVLDDLISALGGIENDSRRAALASQAFGEDAGPKLAAALAGGSRALRDNRNAANELGIVLEGRLLDGASEVRDEFDILTRQLSVDFQSAVLENKDALLGLADSLGDLRDFVIENSEEFRVFGEVVGGLVLLRLGKWALGAVTGIKSLAGAAALLVGPAAPFVALGGILAAIRIDMLETRQETDQFANAIRNLTRAQLESSEQRILAEMRAIQAQKDQLNMFDELGPEQANDLAEYGRLLGEVREALESVDQSAQQTSDSIETVSGPENLPMVVAGTQDLSVAMQEVLGTTVQIPGALDDVTVGIGDAAKETEKLDKDFNRVADTIESAFTDLFFNIFRNGEFSFKNLASSILDIYARMLAEMATQQIITPIIRPQMQGGGQASGGGAGAGGGPADLLGAVTQPGIGGQAATTFAKSNVGQSLGLSQTIQGGRGAMGGKVGAGAAPVELTKTGSNVASTASAATSLAGMGGNLVGTAIGGGTMEASMGATAGQVIGAAIGGPVGSFIGGAIGGAVGGALGDSEMDKAIAKQKESIEKRQDETIATIAQNTRLSESEKERRTAARRERELAGALSEGNRIRLEGLHALEEYADRLQEINRINDERNELERRYLNEIGDTAALRQLELDATESANQGILSFIFSLEDAAKKVQETESNAREAFRALQNTVRREQDAIEERLSGPIDALNSALDSLEGRTLTQRPRLARTQAQTSLSLAREEGIDTLSERNLERALDVVAEPSQQLFGSFTDYQRDFKQTETLVRELRDDAERQRDTQLGALQAQLDQGREQLNALFGINDSVLTVSQAMNNLGASISAAESAQQSFASISAPENAPSFEERPTPPSSLRPGQTNDPLWESIVGRAYEEHIAAFGTDWFGSRTSNQERQAQLARMQNAYLDAKGFADGGMHEGGLRMVGERGPELEVTGPSRIYSNNDTRKMMGTDEMIDEIRSLREEVGELRREQGESQYQITRNTKRTRDTLEKFDIDGLPAERT